MKQKKIVEGAKRNSHASSIRKIGSMLGMGILCVFTISAIGAMSVIGDADIIPAGETVSAQTSISVNEWKKASINEYDFASEAVKVTTKKKTTTTKKTTVTEKTAQEVAQLTTTQKPVTTTVTTAKKTETAKVQTVGAKTMYVKESVNFRTGASKKCDVIKVLEAGKKVTVNGKTNDGWYRVKVDGVTGYCMTDFLTKTAPAKKTTVKASKPAVTNSATIKYTDEELEMMCYVIQNEVGGCSDTSIIAVSNVIINRVKSSRFPNSLSGVLTQANQFTAISNYYNKVNAPTQKVRECVKRALNGEDNSNGAMFYYAPKYCGISSWFESLNFCMELEGQRFFRV